MDKFSELKAAAMAATPGRIGDRIDGSGSIKYECTGYDGSLVLRTNHKDMEYGFVGDNADADELFFRLCVPDVVLELLAELEFEKQNNAGVAGMIEDYETKLEAKDERIAELEAIQADASQVFKEIGNELGCNPDNESIMMAIDELKAIKSAGEKLVRCKGRYHSEQNYRALAALFGVTTPDLPAVDGDSEAVIAELRAKLATPVRLPNKNDDEFWFDGVFQVAKFDRAVERAIRTAGFKFVGYE